MKRMSPAIYLTLVLAPLMGACSTPSAPSSALPAASTSGDSGSTQSSAPVSQNDREAITTAIQKHLDENKGINMAAMEMSVGNVNVTGDQAQADTEFHVKQGGTSMIMTYFLERHGGGWLVVRSQQSDAGQFAHPPMDKIHSGAATPSTAPAVPDVSDFLKNHTSSKSN